MSKIINGNVCTSVVDLTPTGKFKLTVSYLEQRKKNDSLLDVRLVFYNNFKSKSYIETKYIFSVIGLFANRDNYAIDSGDFKIISRTVNGDKIRTLYCSFLKSFTDNESDLRIDMAMAKTMYETFRDITYNQSKKLLLENKVHEDICDVMLSFEPINGKFAMDWKVVPLCNHSSIQDKIAKSIDYKLEQES